MEFARDNPFFKSISLSAFVAAVLGLLFGAILPETNLVSEVIKGLELVAKVWILCLLLIAIPIVATSLLTGFTSLVTTKEIGKMQLIGWSFHLGFLVLGALVSIGLSYLIIKEQFLFPEIKLIQLEDRESVGGYLDQLAAIQSVLSRIIIPVILASLILALLQFLLPTQRRLQLQEQAGKLNGKLFTGLGYLFYILPLAIFALAAELGRSTQTNLISTGALYIVGVCVVLLFACIAIYIVLAILNRKLTVEFFQAMIPTQLFALSTSSSLATLPAIMSTMGRMRMPASKSDTSVPLFVTFFRVNLLVSNPFSYFLLLEIYNLPFELPTFLTFLGLLTLVSFANPGLPQTGNVYSLPVFLAVGIPLEGLLLLKALDTIPDLFKTLLNVTEISAVSVIAFHFLEKRKTPVPLGR